MDMLTEIKVAEQAAEEKKAEAKGRAKVLLEEAQTAAQKQAQEEVAKAKTDAASILQQAREQAAKETAATESRNITAADQASTTTDHRPQMWLRGKRGQGNSRTPRQSLTTMTASHVTSEGRGEWEGRFSLFYPATM